MVLQGTQLGHAGFSFWEKNWKKAFNNPWFNVALNSVFQQQTATNSNVWHISTDEPFLINIKKSLILKAFSYLWEKIGRKLLLFIFVNLLHHIVVCRFQQMRVHLQRG